MEEQTNAAEPAVTEPKRRKSFGQSLRSAAGETLRFNGIIRKTGQVDTFSVLTTRDKKGEPITKRGASASFTGPDALAQAEAHQAKLVKDAVANGWLAKTGGAVKAARPDEFTADALPKPLAGPKDGSKAELIKKAKAKK